MANKWTREQKAVIDHRNSNLLVAAAAGSGKTAVLIERIVRLILDPVNPVDIDRLLVVTFTKAAAREMRERIGIAIEKELSKDPNNIRLQKQRMLLNKADITTIDSFCNNVMRTNFHAIDLDPSVRIGDTAEIEILRGETIEEFFEKKYQEKDEKFLMLVDSYTKKTNDDSLIELIFIVNDFVDSAPYPEMWLEEAAEKFNPNRNDKEEYIDSIINLQLKDAFIRLASLNKQLKDILKDLSMLVGYEKHYKFMEEYASKLDKINKNINNYLDIGNENITTEINSKSKILEDIIEMLNENYVSTKGKAPNSLKNEYKENYKELKDKFDSIKKEVASILDDLRIDPQLLEKENDLIYPYMRALSDLVIEFREYYKEKKLKMSIVEFADVEHFALDILTRTDDDGMIVPSDIARSYQDRYQEIFTDEYQDSNLVQETILDMVSKKNIPNRFMVGDVKQSIYMFRQAMPEIFMNKYKTYKLYKEESGEGVKGQIENFKIDEVKTTNVYKDRKILLYKNFRSRKEVLEACNHVFREIMTSKTGDIDYTDEERLNPGAEFKENKIENSNSGGPVEVYLVDTEDIDTKEKDTIQVNDRSGIGLGIYNNIDDLSSDEIEELKDMEKFRLEAMQIANIIDDMVNPSPNKHRYMIYDKDTDSYRSPSYKDIVVLFRSTKNRGNILEEMLIKRDIPAYIESGGGYFSTIEVTTIINLLKVIDNPIQDIALIATMRSPIFNYTDQELAKIRLADKDSSYYHAIKTFLKTSDDKELVSKLDSFLKKLDVYREEAFLITVDQFIWKLYKDTGYYKYLENISMGEKRQANLILLYEKAKNYESGSYKGLFNFLHYIERLKLTSREPKEARLLSEDADLVRIMTIHKSKGLEFPIVIVANLDKKINLNSNTNILDLDYNLGYGPQYIDIDKKISYKTTAMKIMKKTKKRAIKSEEMRMLYVAMTRAKEKLIFTSSVRGYDRALEKWKNIPRDLDGNIDPASIIGADSYMDLLMPTIVNLQKKDKCRNVRGNLVNYRGYKDCKWTIETTSKYDISREYTQKANQILNDKTNINTVDKSDDIKNISEDIIFTNENMKKCEKKISIKDNHTYSEFKNKTDKKEIDLKMMNEITSFEYKFKSSASKPSSISVTDIKKLMIQEENDQMHDKLYKNMPSSNLKSPLFIHSSKSTKGYEIKHEYKANEKGIIFHLVMQLIDFKAFESIVGYQQITLDGIDVINEVDISIQNEIVRQIGQMVENNILLKEEADTVNIYWIMRFIKSSIYQDILAADKKGLLYKETAINYNIKMKEIYKEQDIADDESMMMVGIIDLFYENMNGDIILLDYKTDYVGEKTDKEIIDRYKVQLDLYERAIEDISGKRVVKKYLYMFSANRLLEC